MSEKTGKQVVLDKYFLRDRMNGHRWKGKCRGKVSLGVGPFRASISHLGIQLRCRDWGIDDFDSELED